MSEDAASVLERQDEQQHPLLATLSPQEQREVQRKKRTMDAFEALFKATAKHHKFRRETLGKRMQLTDSGSGWARFRDRHTKAYITVGMGDGTATLEGDRWTNALMGAFRAEKTPEDLAEEQAAAIRARLKASSWYLRHRSEFPAMYERHHPKIGAQFTYVAMDDVLTDMLSSDCSQAEADELQAACDADRPESPTPSHDIVNLIEDCIADDSAELQVAAFKAHPSFEHAVGVGIQFVSAKDEMERAVAAVRMDRIAMEMLTRAFSREVNPFAVVRDEAAKRVQA